MSTDKTTNNFNPTPSPTLPTFNNQSPRTVIAEPALIGHNGIGHIRIPDEFLDHMIGYESTWGKLLSYTILEDQYPEVKTPHWTIKPVSKEALEVVYALDKYFDSVISEISDLCEHVPQSPHSTLAQRPAIPAYWHTDVYSGNRIEKPEIMLTLPFPINVHSPTICIPWSYQFGNWVVRAPSGYATVACIKTVFHAAYTDYPYKPRGLYTRTWV